MKQKLILTLLALVFSATAQASTDDPADMSSDNLANLIYYVHTGNFRFDPSFSSAIHAGSFGRDESFTNIGLFGSYGAFINGLRFSVTANDGMTAYSSANNSSYYTGFSNPALSANYRFLDSNGPGISADVEFTVTPSTGTRTSGIPGSPGSNAQGAPIFELSAAIFWSQGINEISLSPGIYHAFSGSAVDQGDSDATYNTTSYWEFTTTVTDRFHLCPKLFLQATAEFEFGHSVSYTYPDTTGTTDQIVFHMIPTVEVGYLISKQVLLTTYITGTSYTINESGINDGFSGSGTDFSTSWGMRATLEF